MIYYLTIALQGFCIYHAYRSRSQYYWFFLIIFLPVLGSLVYLFTQVFSEKDINKVQDELVLLVNPTKKISDLEKKFQFNDSFENRVALGDAYLEGNFFDAAIEKYEESLNGVFKNDFYVISNLIKAYYAKNDYEMVIEYAQKIIDKKEFKLSKNQFLYALALEKIGKLDEAEENLKQINIRYSNYEERVFLGNFLLRRDKEDLAKEVFEEILLEAQYMTRPNKKLNRIWVQQAQEAIKQISKKDTP